MQRPLEFLQESLQKLSPAGGRLNVKGAPRPPLSHYPCQEYLLLLQVFLFCNSPCLLPKSVQKVKGSGRRERPAGKSRRSFVSIERNSEGTLSKRRPAALRKYASGIFLA